MASLTPTERTALQLFKQRVAKAFPDQQAGLTLFGSKARGDARKHSDVDVLVVVDRGTWQDRHRVSAITADLILETGVVISPKVLSRAEYEKLRSWGEPLLLNIERDGVAL